MTSTENTPLVRALHTTVDEQSLASEASDAGTDPTTGTGTSLRRRRFAFLIEPAVLLLVFGLNLSGTIFQNQVIYQTCTAVFGYNVSTCELLGTDKATPESAKIETQVQPYAAKVFLTKIILESIVPSFGGLYLGAWSDKNGRKPLLIAAFVGYSLIYTTTSIICWLSSKYTISPWFYILSVVPESIVGGNCVFRIAIFCYVADTTTIEQRPVRMAFLEASIYIGLMAGSLPASYIYAATNALTVFIISASVVVLTTIYVALCVPESLGAGDVEVADLHSSLIKEMLRTCFKPRRDHVRAIVWLIIFTLLLSVFALNGSSAVFYLFTREKFHWTVRDFTVYETFASLIPTVGNVVGMLIMRKLFNVSVTTLALLGLGSAALDSVVKSAASVPSHLYVALGFGCLKAVGGPMCRAIISNIVPETDLGKIFSLANVLESASPFIAVTLYTFVYSQTIATNPSVFTYLTTGLHFLCFIFVAIIFGIKHSNRHLYGKSL